MVVKRGPAHATVSGSP